MSTKRVTGIGGIFFKAKKPTELARWYRDRLGVELEAGSDADESGSGTDEESSGVSAIFRWREEPPSERPGMTVWAVFPDSTKHFSPGSAPFMINYRVEDLDAVLEALRAEDVWVDDHREDSEYGRFAWIQDPEGDRIELWQPPDA
jgi:predicted enzyme related to lactoylglutathione lyase